MESTYFCDGPSSTGSRNTFCTSIGHLNFLLDDHVKWIKGSNVQLNPMHSNSILRFRLYSLAFCGNTVFWSVWVTVNKHNEVPKHWRYSSEHGRSVCHHEAYHLAEHFIIHQKSLNSKVSSDCPNAGRCWKYFLILWRMDHHRNKCFPIIQVASLKFLNHYSPDIVNVFLRHYDIHSLTLYCKG